VRGQGTAGTGLAPPAACGRTGRSRDASGGSVLWGGTGKWTSPKRPYSPGPGLRTPPDRAPLLRLGSGDLNQNRPGLAWYGWARTGPCLAWPGVELGTSWCGLGWYVPTWWGPGWTPPCAGLPTWPGTGGALGTRGWGPTPCPLWVGGVHTRWYTHEPMTMVACPTPHPYPHAHADPRWCSMLSCTHAPTPHAHTQAGHVRSCRLCLTRPCQIHVKHIRIF